MSARDRKLIAQGVAVARSMKGKRPHLAELARQLGMYFEQLTDERLNALYQKLFVEGWAEPEPLPLSTRNAIEHVKRLVMSAVGEEQLSRERGWFDKLNHPDSSVRRLSDAYRTYPSIRDGESGD